jgi:hypothetical protein
MNVLVMRGRRGFPIFSSYMEYCSLLHKALLRWMVEPPSFVNMKGIRFTYMAIKQISKSKKFYEELMTLTGNASVCTIRLSIQPALHHRDLTASIFRIQEVPSSSLVAILTAVERFCCRSACKFWDISPN